MRSNAGLVWEVFYKTLEHTGDLARGPFKPRCTNKKEAKTETAHYKTKSYRWGTMRFQHTG